MVLLILVYHLGGMLFGATAGGLAAWLLVLSPLDALVGTVILSDLPATTALIGALLCLVTAWTRAPGSRMRLPLVAIAGVVCAMGCWIRPGLVVVLPVLALAITLSPGRGPRTRLQAYARGLGSTAAFVVAFGVVYAPLLAWNAATFGSVFRTGYHFWLPSLFERSGVAFSWSHAFGAESAGAWRYLQALVGLSQAGGVGSPVREWYEPLALYGPAVPVLAAVALASVARRSVRAGAEGGALDQQPRFAALAVGVIVVNYFFYSTYHYYDLRFLHLSVPLLVVLAGAGVTVTVARVRAWFDRRGHQRIGSVVPVLVILVMAGVSVRPITRSVVWRSEVRGRPLYSALSYEQMKLVREVTEPNAVVVGTWAPVFFAAYQRGTRRTFVPLYEGDVVPPPRRWRSASEHPAWFRSLMYARPVYYAGEVSAFDEVARQAGVSLETVAERRIPGTNYPFALYRVVAR
jgi:4-amino-4-deoxy-L-arabinose transferase-like glycosyltransferase